MSAAKRHKARGGRTETSVSAMPSKGANTHLLRSGTRSRAPSETFAFSKSARLALLLGWMLLLTVGVILPPLQYQARSPIFFTDFDFFWDHITSWDGWLRYGEAFLLQFYLQPWAGTFISCLLAGLLAGLTYAFLSSTAIRPGPFLTWTPACLVLLLQVRYEYPWLQLVLGVIGILLGMLLYQKCGARPVILRGIAFLILGAGVLWLTGGGFFLFAVWCILAESFRSQPWHQRLGFGILFAGLAVALLVLASGIMVKAPVADFSELWLPRKQLRGGLFAVWGLWIFYLLAWIWLHMFPGLATARSSGSSAGRRSWQLAGRRILGVMAARPNQQAGLLVVLGLTSFWALFDRQAKLRWQIEYANQQQQWNHVLEAGSVIRNPTPATISDINRALCHLGQLPDNMFAYPQRTGWDFWFYPHETLDSMKTLRAADLLYDIGQINCAERMAGEALELCGEQPPILQRLALINILKGKPQAARIFLNRLAHTLTHRPWAQHYLDLLATDPTGAQDQELQHARQIMLKKDYAGEFATEALLHQLLQQNGRNRQAFEYLMAHYLLTSQLDKIAAYLGGILQFEYSGIPRHYEEAILLYEKLNPDKPVALYGRSIRPQTRKDFQRFNELVRNSGGDLKGVRPNIQASFGNTYWFFYLYGCSGSMADYVNWESSS